MYTYIKESAVMMREGPSQEARIASEALYAEPILILEQIEDWARIQTPDGYQGWISPKTLLVKITPYALENVTHTCRKSVHIYHVKDTEWGAIKTLPFGCPLHVMDDSSDERWIKILLLDDREAYVHRGDVAPLKQIQHPADLIPIGHQFLDLPYTWGGRSSFGFDCSGFMQMLYSHLGILLPRDSCCQIKDERFLDVSLEKMEAGDLIFFGKDRSTIRHVGMAIDKEKFIHTSPIEHKPFLRVSCLTDMAWSGSETVKYPFRQARRFTGSQNS